MLDIAEARRIARSYPHTARHVPRWERERYLNETQQLAWLLRFDPEAAEEVISAVQGVHKTVSQGTGCRRHD